MTMLKVANCPKCGKVFQMNLRSLCQGCQRELDSEFDQCSAYLRDNRKASTEALSEATGVPVQRIYTFIQDNRLPVSFYPGLTYPCKSCGSPIRQQKMCTPCRVRIISDVKDLENREARARDRGAGFQIRERFSRV
ncbi:flagellar protein [Paenibacillus validus]|uniref:flagellar protein n=1 Tax=Paenibacillus TaxID=44249 RepID=UPI000FD88AF0|nr:MULTISPECIES: flagellar protein [Paenibacillus]MED4603451.1 flagellar protein [Paenibacillus validus]MED4608441.1 flagellar protein [Paenibacillus validus]